MTQTGQSPGAALQTAGAPAPKSLIARAWARLLHAFGNNPDGTLRESLEDVIEQHDAVSEDIGPEERTMLLNILEFASLRVDDVMVPRADISAVSEDARIGELLTLFEEAGHSRLPVYRDTLDDPLGMLHIKDLLPWLSELAEKKGTAKKPSGKAKNGAGKTASAVRANGLKTRLRDASIMRDILFVPPSMPAVDLLVKMQSTRIHLAIVVDEYGGTDGLVSIEDLVEEIVGEIEDEHDRPDRPMIEARDGDYLADARAPVEELEALLKIDLLPDERDEDVDTLGGLVFSLVGRVPVRGELIRHASGIEFEVLEADPRRIKQLCIHLNGSRSKS